MSSVLLQPWQSCLTRARHASSQQKASSKREKLLRNDQDASYAVSATAFYACPEDATRLAGSFYNAHAVVLHALKLAQERTGNISLVCSGELGYFALDDATCAGYLALELQRLATEHFQEIPLHLHESVYAATALYEAYKPPKVLEYCDSAQSVFQAGLVEDPYFCIQTSKSTSIPMVVGREEETGLLVLEQV